MFREIINCPIDPIPVEYTNTLNRITNEPDYSLTCLGLAMLKPRIKDYKGITGVYLAFNDASYCVTDFVDRIKDATDECPTFCYYKYSRNDFNQQIIDEQLAEFKEKKTISAFVTEKTANECKVLYHETKNIVAIFVNTVDTRLYHLLLSFMSLYYPSLFKEHPLEENDYNLIKSLSKKERKDFYECVKKAVQPYITEFRRVQMSGFMKQIHEQKIKSAEQQVSNQRFAVDQLEERYADALRALQSLIVTYEGLKATEKYDDPEENLVEYLSTNPNIHKLAIKDNRITFCVSTLLNNYNADAWKIFSERGHIFDGEYGARIQTDVFKNIENRKLLFNNIFSEDPKLMVRMAGNYMLNLSDYRVSTSDRYDYEDVDPMFKDYVPNPHLKLFSCLGGYKERVMRALKDRNYIAAIELCIASAGSVNLDETTQTFRPFLGWIINSTNKILVTKDGKEMTPEEALVWLADGAKKDD